MTILSSHVPPSLPSPAFTAEVRRPGELLNPGGHIFAEVEKVVQRHLFALQVLKTGHPKPQRFLVVTGMPGTGKTMSVTDAALRFGNAVIQLSAANVASPNEGGATEVLESYLADAVRHSQIHKEPVAIIADDFDCGIISVGKDTGNTINTGLVVQKLQSLADSEDYRNYDGSRIALIFTGNDWSNVRSSLFREGRATWYEHVVSPQEMRDFVFHLFTPATASEQRLLEKLVRRYRKESAAFWATVKSSLRHDIIDALLASGVTDPAFIQFELGRPRPLLPGQLLRYARAHARARRLISL